MSATALRVAGAVAAAALLAGCVPMTPDADTYDDKAYQTLGSAISDVTTVQRIVQTSKDGRMLGPTATAQLRYSEDGLDTATKAFTELTPPPSRDRLDHRVSTLLGQAGDLLAEARVALERDSVSEYAGLVKNLGKLATELEKLEGTVS